MFAGREVTIVTKHGKEQVIGPCLQSLTGVSWKVADGVDTDQLGTFAGEIERADDPITCARRKCLLALEQTDCDLVLSSEGSFGPHPTIGFIPANEEILLLMDRRHNREIIARVLSTSTNYHGEQIRSREELSEFIKRVEFPSHGLIIRAAQNDFTGLQKGITDPVVLHNLFASIVKLNGSAYVETDMRAMFNPTRMNVIKETALRLAYKMNSRCPECGTPGFDISEYAPGLPCAQCNAPTRSSLIAVSTCSHCSYTHQQYYPKGKKVEDPTYCDYCNP